MGLQTVAEFVENKKILDKLNKIGVDFVQGFHFGEVQNLIGTNKFK
ncbi:MAG: EAL domain-containing protein [Gammaproteobacteria bacterium]